MWVLVQDGQITKTFNYAKGFVLNDTQYPADIFTKWSKAEKEAIGIYEIETDSSNYKDPAYYNNTNEEYTFANNKVVKSWGTATPKRLEDENAVDEDGNPVLDDDGVQLINYGLKTEKKRIVKQQASGLLAPTDWYVVKASEVADYTVPADITTYRTNVRAKSNEMEQMIDACGTVDDLKTLYDYVNTGTEQDPVYTRPLGEWPEEVI
jgi:hypothetical protein